MALKLLTESLGSLFTSIFNKSAIIKVLLSELDTIEDKDRLYDMLKPTFESLNATKQLYLPLFHSYVAKYSQTIKYLFFDHLFQTIASNNDAIFELFDSINTQNAETMAIFLNGVFGYGNSVQVRDLAVQTASAIGKCLETFYESIQNESNSTDLQAKESKIKEFLSVFTPTNDSPLIISTCFLSKAKNIHLLLSLSFLVDCKMILEFLKKMYSYLTAESFSQEMKIVHDIVWAALGLKVAENLALNDSIDLFWKVAACVNQTLGSSCLQFVDLLVPYVGSHINLGNPGIAFKLLAQCAHSRCLKQLYEISIDNWTLNSFQCVELIDLISMVHSQFNVIKFEESTKMYLLKFDLKGNSAQILKCLKTVHPRQLLDLIPYIIETIIIAESRDDSIELLRKIRKSLSFPINGKGVKWFDETIKCIVENASKQHPVGVQAILHSSLLRINLQC
jgi:hypothetical protein